MDFDEATFNESTCAQVSSVSTYLYMTHEGIDLTNASCPPSLNEAVPEANWGTQARACRPSGPQECGSGTSICMEELGGAYASGACIWREGDYACPEEYSTRTLYYKEFSDSRSCADDCSCSNLQAECLSGVEVYEGSACAGAFLEATLQPGDCINAGMNGISNNIYAKAEAESSSGTCTASGGTPTGEVIPQEPVTICCNS